MNSAPSGEPGEITQAQDLNDANQQWSSMTPVIELRGITKRFGPIEVLSNVDLGLHAGRVHSLAGENGAGKSTLVKILGGIYQPDSGKILKDGLEITILDAADARRQGIAVVHQHPAVFPDLSVAENVFVGRQPRQTFGIDWAAMIRRAEQLLSNLRIEIDVRVPVKMLSIAERQAIEIARALSIDARVLVMDEPTSAISSHEIDRLFEIVQRLKQQGVAVLFISHFIDEILGLGDEVTILRSGKRVITAPTSDLSPEQTVRQMIGTEPAAFFPKEETQIGVPALAVRGLSGAGFVKDVSFDVRAGEILGFFGLVGSGRSEVAQMLFGITQPDQGEIRLGGQAVHFRSSRQAMRLGISLLPEDRHQQGLVLPFPIRANETLPILRELAQKLGLVDRSKETQIARDFAGRMRVVATGVEQPTNTLSGGNQQKVLLAKWLIPSPKVLILDEPTRGVDVGAKAEIHRIISHLAAQGLAVILISDDAREVIGMADRIIVFRDGGVAAESTRGSFNREAILLAAAHADREQNASAVPPDSPKKSVEASTELPAGRSRRLMGQLMRIRELGLVLALLLICLGVTIREPRFLQGANLEQVALSATLVCIVALGEAFVIIARQIDLSVGAIVATSAFISASWLEHNPNGSILSVLLMGCAVGGVLGIVNALLVTVFRIPAIVATLGTLAMYRGGVIVLAGGRQISATVLPDSYGDIARAHFCGVPLLVWLAILFTVGFGLAARFTRTGRNLYALGSNLESARFAGINEQKHIGLVFVVSGLLCGLVGVLWGARFGTVDAVIAPDLHLQAISAVVVGGVSIFGGSGSVYGATLGAVIFAVLQNGVQLLGINRFWLQAVLGATIVVTVIFYSQLAKRAERAQRKSRRGQPVRKRIAS
ncbi:MAG TPA: ATP-binding cassette domain-containing protein [Chthoniobacterales bacterium]|nr:ATP-binding cassette domain-containing protein [Chthoniobacterales bacterium]